MPDFSLKDEFTSYKPGFASVDWNFNADPAGQLYRPAPINQPPQAKSVESLAAELLQKQRAQAEAVRLQHKIDNIYERAMGEAPRRDIEVLPPETPAEALDRTRTRTRNVTPIDERQEISNLLENQLKRPQRPSTAVPPGNANTSGARVSPLIDIQATPTPASPRTPLAVPTSAIEVKPKSLPVPVGRIVTPVAGGLVDFGLRVVTGQDPIRAGYGAVGSTLGSVAGASAGSLVGPLGTFVGGLIGGLIGGVIADSIYNLFPTKSNSPEVYKGLPPYTSGQCNISYNAFFSNDKQLMSPGSRDSRRTVYGKVLNVRRLPDAIFYVGINSGYGGQSHYEITYLENDKPVTSDRFRSDSILLKEESIPYLVKFVPVHWDVTDGNCGDPSGTPIPPDSRTPLSIAHPGNQSFAPSRGLPGINNTNPAPNNYAPGGLVSGGSSRGDGFNWVPHASLAPKSNPNPNTTFNNLGGNLPSIKPDFNNSPNPDLNPYLPSTNNKNNPNPNAGNPPASRPYGPATQPIPSGPPTIQDKLPPTPSKLPTPSNNPTPLILPPKTFEAPPQTEPQPQLEPQPQPQPQPQPPSTNAPTTTSNICKEPCIVFIKESVAEINYKLEANNIFWVEIKVPTVTCEFQDGEWKPKVTEKEIQVLATPDGSEVLKTLIQFEEIAKIASEQCLQKNRPEPEEYYAAIPDWWQIRPEGHRPQLVIQFGEDLGNGKVGPPKYVITIPHYKGGKLSTSPIPKYKKGSWEEIVTLSDNSKIIVNAFDQEQANKVINACLPIIDPKYSVNSYAKGGRIRKGRPLKEIVVIPKMARFFSTGYENMIPDWIVRF